jgi:EAL domain-containing protein (putative c-di-GMP-specific phosphodiesterase class I)
MSQITLKKFKKGDLIFRAGEDGECAYIVDLGRVQIFTENIEIEAPLSILGPGEIFGEMAILDRSPRTTSARALEDMQVSVVSRQQFEQRMDQADPIVRLLVSILLKRVRNNLNPENKIEEELDSNFNEQKKIEREHNHNKVIEKIKFEAELFEALVNDSFMLYFQPIVNSSNGKAVGFEALIRWQSETRGMVRPDLFMGVAEETSLIVPIGKWVFEKACECLNGFQTNLKKINPNMQDFFVTVNISGKQFSDVNFFQMLEVTPQKYGVSEKHLKLEITEKILLEGNIFFYWIEKCRNLGFPVSLDDFGTGYSMLSYLSDFNVDNIKIDQSFIRKIEQDHKTRIIVQAIINIAKGLGIEVIAEGVETEKQARILSELGCEYLQGYYFGRPTPYLDALKFLEKNLG